MFKRVLELDKDHVRTLYNYGVLLYEKRKDIDGADTTFKRVLELNKDDVQTLYIYGILLYNERNDIDGAETMYKRVLELDKNHVQTLHNYGIILTIENESKNSSTASKELFKKALGMLIKVPHSEMSGISYYCLGFCYNRLGMHKKALENFILSFKKFNFQKSVLKIREYTSSEYPPDIRSLAISSFL